MDGVLGKVLSKVEHRRTRKRAAHDGLLTCISQDANLLNISCAQLASEAFAILVECGGSKGILRPFKGKLVNAKGKYEVYVMAPGEGREDKSLPKC